MSREESINRAISNAAASVEMEGYRIDEDCKEWCRKVLLHEMTHEEYLELLLKKAGVIAS
ncbi:MAG: hypothetical protein IJ112_02940 [Oscillospiraceae bacterium]|nr:hypothetical protein [Oscillospiraceae bacterium]